MIEAFKPIGERARWRIIYDLFREAEYGDTITYEQMAESLGLAPRRDRHTIQMAARRAGIELEKVDRRAVDSQRGVGYRVVQPAEVVGLGRKRNTKAGNQIVRGGQVTNAVDLNLVDGPTKDAIMALARGFAVQADINRSVLARQKKHDGLIDLLMRRVDQLENKLEGRPGPL